jgi:hypothetical protein
MKILLLPLLFLQEPQASAESKATDYQETIKIVHIGFTRFMQADLVRIKETDSQHLLAAELTFFGRNFRYAGTYSGHFIKKN